MLARMRGVVVGLIFGLVGCAGGASGGRDVSGQSEACSPPYRGAASTFRCEDDDDCGFCHDGSACGTVMSTAEITHRGAACQQADTAECELATARCCDGLCTTSGYALD